MKRFIGFIKKEFYHIFRDRRSLIILFGMPIAQILLFGFAITNEINNVDIAILDHSKDANTKEIKSDAEVIFGNIKQNLNPNITDPPTSCAKQMLITKRSDRGDGYNE